MDLARALKVAQSTVAGWRKRGSVPDRYLSAGRATSATPSPPRPCSGTTKSTTPWRSLWRGCSATMATNTQASRSSPSVGCRCRVRSGHTWWKRSESFAISATRRASTPPRRCCNSPATPSESPPRIRPISRSG
ncbi:MAG: hypothetical protein JKP98_21690 [Rhodobacteraceae bacterium]|nr:hypothetical protein [Paracoccaceae bacterium]